MQNSVATLLIVVSAVMLCIVPINYAVNVMRETVNNSNLPQFNQIHKLQNEVENITQNTINNITQYNSTEP